MLEILIKDLGNPCREGGGKVFFQKLKKKGCILRAKKVLKIALEKAREKSTCPC